MPGPPIRKPSDHSPPAGSPRNIAGHHVLHRPLMPRHPPNAQKNKQQQHTTKQTLPQKTYSKMLASTIQFTTNPPTPTPTTHKTGSRKAGQATRAHYPRTPTACHPHTRKHHARESTHHHQNRQQQACLLHQHTATSHPTPATQARSKSNSQLPSAGAAPAGPDHPRPRQQQTTRKPPPHNLSLERR